MKLKNYFALVLMGVMLLTSCNKDEDLKGDKGVSTGKTEVFTASITEVEAFDLLEYGADEHEARASVKSKGYAVPRLEVSLEELKDSSTQAHWGVLGDSQTPLEESVPNTKIVVAEPESTPTESTLFFKASTDPLKKNVLKFYCPVGDDLKPVSNKWAYFAVGGERNGQYLEFNKEHNTSPNAKIVGIMKDEPQLARQIPLMTDVMAFNKILGEGKTKVKLKPRGCLIGLCFVNKLDEDITITDIVVPKYNALYFEGKFDMQNSTESTTAPYSINFKNSTCTDNRQTKFDGGEIKDEEEFYPYPVYDNNTTTNKGYVLQPVGASSITQNIKDNLPIFHLWGMPRTSGCGQDRLSFYVKFTKGGTELKTRIFSITLPRNKAFKEGKSYRLAILLNEKALPTTYGSGRNPLMYVAENSVNRGASLGPADPLMPEFLTDLRPHPTGFVNHYNMPTTGDVRTHLPTDVGYFTFNEAIALFDSSNPAYCPFLANYVLPTLEQWNSIVPSYDKGEYYIVFKDSPRDPNFLEKALKKRVVNDKMIKIGSEAARTYNSDFITKAECPYYVTYALRFKGTPHESAWRYSWSYTRNAMIIECIGGFQYSGKKLIDISYPEFFSENTHTVKRIFPAYGKCGYDDDTAIHPVNKTPLVKRPNDGFYWSSSILGRTNKYADKASEFLFFNEYEPNMDFSYHGISYNIRPFKKTLD